ncbi:GNAT family N-acetyltransferase [Pseudenhygromyxa sp. WMMC2535]|uniref:GNAT family N-acetyltransferase n=1 Tax=Pseudenhygromyxa sp. WMMC2535 TaxID=2712867 RepID=UPI001557E0B1|nr:GNAT family N-acetyltransferase [Pseudenhygromyxa sp. WMMC2535]NVB42097.1 GNAT family N-acetyltransferase [Pseudenhygromyxa sp. WMMC2535]
MTTRAIRDATLDDLDAIMAVDAACFPKPWSRPAWVAEITAGGRERPLVLLSAPPVAFACAPLLDERCELRRIAVLPGHRGQGLAGDLLAAVIARAQASGCERVELEVSAENQAALALYKSAEFRVVGRRPGYYRDPPSDALLLDLALR